MLFNIYRTFLRLQSCAVAKFFIPLQQLQQKTIIMVYRNFSLTGVIIPCQVLRIVHLCSYATAQPHTYTTARLGGCAVTHVHVSGIVHLCSCAVAYPHGRAAVQSCSCVNNIQYTGKMHSCAVTQPQKCTFAIMSDYTTTQPHSRRDTKLQGSAIVQPHVCAAK